MKRYGYIELGYNKLFLKGKIYMISYKKNINKENYLYLNLLGCLYNMKFIKNDKVNLELRRISNSRRCNNLECSLYDECNKINSKICRLNGIYIRYGKEGMELILSECNESLLIHGIRLIISKIDSYDNTRKQFNEIKILPWRIP